MQIKEIYVDMDGVIADFDQLANMLTQRLYGKPVKDLPKRNMWHAISLFQQRGNRFWESLPPMQHCERLMDFIHNSGIDYGILSAVGNKGFNANPQKMVWLAKTFPNVPTIRLVQSSSDKAKYAGPGIVLIDDRRKSIDPWIEAGGIGILHKDVDLTLIKLKELIHGD